MRVEAIYTGKVQGVGFRASASRIAHDTGVVGWVRNEADGAVKLVAEGEGDALDRLLDSLDEDMNAFISSTRVDRSKPERGYEAFEIKY